MADRLKAAGYRTALVGKWHLGSAKHLHPMSRGFDEFYGFLGGDHSYVESSPDGMNPLYEDRTRVEASGYLTDVLTDRAVAFIEREKSRPFFLYLAYNAVHTPMQAPRSTWRGSRASPTTAPHLRGHDVGDGRRRRSHARRARVPKDWRRTR